MYILQAESVQLLKSLCEIPGAVHPDRMTITGKTLYENVKDAEIMNDQVIRRKENPYSPVGGLSVLFGNIAPEGGVIKVGAVDPSIKEFSGKAIVFESQEDAQEAIDNGTVQEGHVVVIRYEGPKGGPGMPEMLAPTSAITRTRIRNESGTNYRRTIFRGISRDFNWTYFTRSCRRRPNCIS